MNPEAFWRRSARFVAGHANQIKIRLFVTYFVIIIVLIMGIGSFSYYYSSKSVEMKVQNSNAEIINQINKNLETNFQQIKSIMLVPYYNTDFLTGLSVYEQMTDHEKIRFQQKMWDYFLKAFYLTQRTDFQCFYLFSREGKLLFTSNSENGAKIEADYRNAPWVRETIRKNGRIYFGGAYQGIVRNRKELLFSAALMIKNFNDSENYSIVRADFDFNIISGICNNKSLGNEAAIIVVDEHGKVVYSTGEYRSAAPFRSAIIRKMRGDSGSFWAKIGRKRYMINYEKSRTSSWNIISMISADDIFDASTKIKRITIIISIFAFLLTAVISMIFAAKITDPIRELNQALEKVRRSNLEVRIQSNRQDEIGNIFHIFNTLLDEINELIKTKYVYQLKQREYELNLLYAQINPHFLYNTLDTIRAMADYHDMDDVARMVNLLADLFRYSVRDINEMVSVNQELNYIRDYLTICQIRFNDHFAFMIDPDKVTLDYQIPRLILQPVIENAVLHGLREKTEKGHLKIRALLKEQAAGARAVEFRITDDGIGIPEAKLDQLRQALHQSGSAKMDDLSNRSIGLANIKNRLWLLYGANQYLRIESEPGRGTEVILTVPVNPMDNSSVSNERLIDFDKTQVTE